MTTEFAMRRFQIDGSIRFSYTSFVGFAMKILHTLLRGYAHTRVRMYIHTRVCVDGQQWQSKSNPMAISYQIISFAEAWTLGNVYARVMVIYGKVLRGSV